MFGKQQQHLSLNKSRPYSTYAYQGKRSVGLKKNFAYVLDE